MSVDESALVSLGRKIDRLTKELNDLASEIKASRLAVHRSTQNKRIPAPANIPVEDDADLLDTGQVAALVNRRPSTVKFWRSRGKGPPFFRLPGNPRVLYRQDEVMKWLQTAERDPTPRPPRAPLRA